MIRVDYLALARTAKMVDGLPVLVDPGINIIRAQSFPHYRNLAAGFRLEIPWDDTLRQTHIALDMVDSEGRSVFRYTRDRPATFFSVEREQVAFPEEEQYLSDLHTLDELKFTAPGIYYRVMRLDGKEAARVRVRLVLEAEGGSKKANGTPKR